MKLLNQQVQAKEINKNLISGSLSQNKLERLARSWCELVLGQLQGLHHQQVLPRAIEAKTGENYRHR